jgi:tight adherence protein B
VSPDSPTYAYAGIGLLAAGAAAAIFFTLRSRSSAPVRWWHSRCAVLDRRARFLRLRVTGATIGLIQLAAAACLVVAALFTARPILLVAALMAIALPGALLSRAERKRVERIEQQLDGWLLMLANMLRTSGAPGDAVAASATLVQAPIRDELELCLKEMRLGTPLESALLQMGQRVGSRTVSNVLSMIIIGSKTGGDLPALLETAAASLREMARLEGVIRTKTALAKTQIKVLAAAPPVIAIGYYYAEPSYFDPLTESATGSVVIAVAVLVYLTGVILARRILDIEL